jgi:hypothetical protein
MADTKRDGYEPPVVEQSPENVVAKSDKLPIGYIAVAPDDLAELRRKAAMWDAHEARRMALENADAEFWAKIASIKEGFGI